MNLSFLKTRIANIVFVLIFVFLVFLMSWNLDFTQAQKPKIGITFSQYYSQEKLNLDWKKAYLSLIEELNPDSLRLIAYWQYLEPEKNNFNFDDLDWQMEKAEEHGKKVILVIGHRVPRWPECHQPKWAENLEKKELQNSVLEYLVKIVNHYKENTTIEAWQIENEPLLSLFGECPEPDKEFLKKEISLVRSLDKARPIIITDSGELSLWLRTAGMSEILGVSLYKVVWNKYLGYFRHFYPPFFYTARSWISQKIFGNQKVIITELQGEPWFSDDKKIEELSPEEQYEIFGKDDLKNIFDFAKKTGVQEIYFWGDEWWYWLKEKKNDSLMWDTAKVLLKNN